MPPPLPLTAAIVRSKAGLSLVTPSPAAPKSRTLAVLSTPTSACAGAVVSRTAPVHSTATAPVRHETLDMCRTVGTWWIIKQPRFLGDGNVFGVSPVAGGPSAPAGSTA